MKKKILTILMAIAVGAILALPTLSMAFKENIKKENMYVLQLGVFKNYANALEKKESVKGSMIYQNKGLYYVLAGLSKEETGLYKISYYPNNLEKYNLLLQKASDEETIKSLNEKVLKEVVKSEFQN